MEQRVGYPFKDELTFAFHAHYRKQTSTDGPPYVKWMGYDCLKCPMDLWAYQEILHDIQPNTVIECGTAGGGTTLFLAHTLDAIGNGLVVSVDWDKDCSRPVHSRIKYICGDTEGIETFKNIERISVGRKVLILDDGHAWEHVLAELELLTPILGPGDYLIVEDTDLGGPLWGLNKFLESGGDKRFQRDSYRERFLLTFNPLGYLKCIA